MKTKGGVQGYLLKILHSHAIEFQFTGNIQLVLRCEILYFTFVLLIDNLIIEFADVSTKPLCNIEMQLYHSVIVC